MDIKGSGIKRSTPDGGMTDNRRMLPDQIYANLAGRVTKFALADAPDVRDLFDLIATEDGDGIRALKWGHEVQKTFCFLIEQQEFELFAETFTRYNQGRVRHAAHTTWSFEPTLHLKLPRDWICGDKNAMYAAFEGLDVEVLKVEGPPHCVDGHIGFYPVVSEDACLCIHALLQATGVTKLHITGALAKPDLIAQTFNRTNLQVLRLAPENDWDALTKHEWVSHKTLCAGVANCPTLKHLTFSHSLKQALAILKDLCRPGAPELLSLALDLREACIRAQDGYTVTERAFDREVSGDHDDERDGDDDGAADARRAQAQKDVIDLMTHVRKLTALTALTVELELRPLEQEDENDLNRLKSVFLEPLSGHPNLEMLTIQDVVEHDFNPTHINVLLDVASFSITCPRLTYVHWKTAEFTGNVVAIVNAFKDAGGTLDDWAASQRLAQTIASDKCKLKTLIVGGAVVTTPSLAGLCRGLRSKGVPLVHIDVAACLVCAGAAPFVTDALEVNLGIEEFRLPGDPSSFFLEGLDGRVYRFASNDKQKFELEMDELGDDEDQDAINAAAQAAFLPIEAEANALLSGVPAKLAENRRTLMTKIASRALTPSLAEVLARSKAATDLGITPGGVNIASEIMLQHLANAGEFPSAVRILSQVAKVDFNNELNKKPGVRELAQQDLDKKENRKEAIRAEQRVLHAQLRQTVSGYVFYDEFESHVDRMRFTAGEMAVLKGDVDTVLDLIEDGLMLNVVTYGERIANILLDIAARTGHADMLRILLDAGAIDVGDEVQQTAPDVDVQEVFRRHALAVTTTNSTTGTTTTTTSTTAGATTGATPALDAARHDAEPTEAEQLLHDQALDAIAAGDLVALQNALDAGAPRDLTEDDGNMLLVAAVKMGNIHMVRLLIKEGAEDYFGIAVALAGTGEMVAAFDGA